tara:strand:- start:27 stop:233 length:207 start_codon:yes stop_codon:yes gene_type:complete
MRLNQPAVKLTHCVHTTAQQANLGKVRKTRSPHIKEKPTLVSRLAGLYINSKKVFNLHCELPLLRRYQ